MSESFAEHRYYSLRPQTTPQTGQRILEARMPLLGIPNRDAEPAGTALMTAGCHAVDALRWFARTPVEEVSAYHVRGGNPADYPGTISINIKFKDGKIGRSMTTFDAKMPYRFNIGIYGPKARSATTSCSPRSSSRARTTL